jgi:hypothetical protein
VGRRGGIGIEVVEPEADGGGVAVEAALTAGLATDEAGDEVLDGGEVEEEGEGPELGGVLPMLEGVEVAFGCAGAGSSAAPSAAVRAGSEHGVRPPFGGGLRVVMAVCGFPPKADPPLAEKAAATGVW